jgi:hypothetical protein
LVWDSTFGKGRDFLKHFEANAASYTIRTGSFFLKAKAAGATPYHLPSSSRLSAEVHPTLQVCTTAVFVQTTQSAVT